VVRDDAALDPATLPAGVQLAAVRVVQESLTNVLKHASGASARVRLWGTGPDGDAPPAVGVEVVDDGRAAGPGKSTAAGTATGPSTGTGDGLGRGLIGLRERVEALGGTFTAGPLPDGDGFTVRAVLPVGA